MEALDARGREFIYRSKPGARPPEGFHWNGTAEHWYTYDPRVAVKLRAVATEAAKKLLQRSFIVRTPWTLPLPSPPAGRKLKPYQRRAVLFALGQNRSYLGLDPGLGKTACAATVAEALRLPTVYVTPPFLVENVKEEFRRWAPKFHVFNYGTEPLLRGTQMVIVPDSLLARDGEAVTAWLRAWVAKRPALLIVDEAHRFKNENALRTVAVLDLLTPAFSTQVYLSGTPMPNRPMELFPLLKKVAPETIDFMDRHAFGRRYCNGKLKEIRTKGGKVKKRVWDFTGASNMVELRQRVIVPDGLFMLRLKKDVLALPPKLEEVFIISAGLPARLAKLDKDVTKAFGGEADLVKDVVSASADEHVATYRKQLGLYKVKPAAEYIEHVLESGQKHLIVFAYHKEVIAKLKEALAEHSPAVITGSTPAAERHQTVAKFQKGQTRVIIGNYHAMGVGFTLTKATRVIFVEYSWVPGDNWQASDRAHRIGQTGTVLVQYMAVKDSLDKKVLESNLKKREAINYV